MTTSKVILGIAWL